MPWYVYLALKQLFSTRQRIFFTVISAISVALGVTLLLVVLSVMAGFGDKVREMTVDTQGDIQIRAEQLIDNPAQLESVVAKVPGVVATTPFAEGFVLLTCEDHPSYPVIQGIDPDTVQKVVPIDKYIRLGSLNDLDDDSIILSSQLAVSIGATLGGKVEVASPTMFWRFLRSNEVLLPREFTVVGIIEFGHQQLDKSTAIVTLRAMQDLYDLGGSVHGLDVKIAPNLDVEKVTRGVNQAMAAAEGKQLPVIPGLWAQSWKTINQDFLWAVQLEKNIMTFILLIVVVVAAFLTMSLLLVLVFKKTREIGLLGALGATRRQVALCFCFQGVCIGIVGTALGLVFGSTLLHYRDAAVRLITDFTGSEEALANIYQFTQMPSHTTAGDLTTIIVAAILLSTLAGAVPALIAARLDPVEALRNE